MRRIAVVIFGVVLMVLGARGAKGDDVLDLKISLSGDTLVQIEIVCSVSCDTSDCFELYFADKDDNLKLITARNCLPYKEEVGQRTITIRRKRPAWVTQIKAIFFKHCEGPGKRIIKRIPSNDTKNT